jgi:hypothetical protein
MHSSSLKHRCRMMRLAVCWTFAATVWAQPQVDQVPSAKTILDLPDSEQVAFIKTTMEHGFPEDRADQMTMLIINRSALSVSLIEAKVEELLKSPSPSRRSIDIASEMIAYAGDEQSLRAISRLIAIDEPRFGRLVARVLDNAGNWRNPFMVAYRGFELGDDAVSRYTVAWAESALASNSSQRVWAEAMLDRYGKVPGDSEWATDPIASRLEDRASPELRRSVSRLATEAQRNRGRR